MPEAPEYFDNVTVGQYAMTGVPLKVYVNGEYLTITDPDDIENPLIGFGMLPNGEMEQFDYKQVEHLLVSGNVVDLETYKKAMEDDDKEEGEEEEGEEEEGEEEGGDSEEEDSEEEPEAPGEDLSKEESVMPSLASLIEITKDVKKAREKALDAEEDAIKDKRKALDDEPITDGVINEADYETTMRRKYGANKDYTNVEVQDIHFQTDPKEFEAMMSALGKKYGAMTAREEIADAEYELKRFRKSIKYGDGKSLDPFVPGTYEAATSKLGDGPHKKARPTVSWNEKKYDQWIEDVASGGGADHAYDMAQNAKMEPGLINWVKKNRLGFGDVTPLERIQYDIEALAESVNEAKDKVDVASLSTGNTYKDNKGYPVKVIDIKGTGNRWKITYQYEDGKKKTVSTSLDKGINLYESEVNEAKEISRSKIDIMGSKILGKIKIGTTFVTDGGDYTVTGFGPKSNAFQEFDAEKDGKPCKVKLSVMYGVKLEVTDDPRSRVYRKEEMLNSMIFESVNEMKMVHKGKDITKYVLAYMEKKITKSEFEKLTGLKKDKLKVNESVIADILIIADENNTYELFTAELVNQKYLMPDELEDPKTKEWLEDTYAAVHESISLKSLAMEARKPRGYYEKKFKHLKKKPKYKKGDQVVYVQDLGGRDELSPETSRVKKVSKGLAGFKYDLTNYIQTNDSEILGLAESVNEATEFKKGDEVKYIGRTSVFNDLDPKEVYVVSDVVKDGKGGFTIVLNPSERTPYSTYKGGDTVKPEDLELAESVNEDHMGAPYEYDNISEPYSIKVGDMVQNTNPSCPHHGSQGMVKKVMSMPNDIGDLIKYVVMNQGDTYRAGDVLTKTPDQLEVM